LIGCKEDDKDWQFRVDAEKHYLKAEILRTHHLYDHEWKKRTQLNTGDAKFYVIVRNVVLVTSGPHSPSIDESSITSSNEIASAARRLVAKL
jgi:hypothetical protein